MKPSERIRATMEASRMRYASEDIDTREIATILNVIKEMEKILDELYGELVLGD